MAVGLPLQAWANRRAGAGWVLGLANLWLLVASMVFYAWGEVYLVWVMVASCLLNYAGGLWCEPGRAGRRAALIGVVTANLVLLAWFKYSGLAAASWPSRSTVRNCGAQPVSAAALPEAWSAAR